MSSFHNFIFISKANHFSKCFLTTSLQAQGHGQCCMGRVRKMKLRPCPPALAEEQDTPIEIIGGECQQGEMELAKGSKWAHGPISTWGFQSES